jgi:large subunit ribosomal protein L33
LADHEAPPLSVSRPSGRRTGVIVGNKKKRINVKMQSTESAYVYSIDKNNKLHPQRMELRKYDPIVKKHVLFKESK